MKTKLLVFALVFVVTIASSFAQKNKTKNVILISIDGYRWQEIFKGADSSLLFQKKYRKQDSAELVKKYWAATANERRQKLMPFFGILLLSRVNSMVTAI
ncbi:hypothetical protein [Pedobacter steynii]